MKAKERIKQKRRELELKMLKASAENNSKENDKWIKRDQRVVISFFFVIV